MNTSPIRHRRMGPGLEVALCGERGLFIFAPHRGGITCPTCKAKSDAIVKAGTGVSQRDRLMGAGRARAARCR